MRPQQTLTCLVLVMCPISLHVFAQESFEYLTDENQYLIEGSLVEITYKRYLFESETPKWLEGTLIESQVCGEEQLSFNVQRVLEVSATETLDDGQVTIKNVLPEFCIPGSDVDFEHGLIYFIAFEKTDGEYWFLAAYRTLEEFSENFAKDMGVAINSSNQ